jgi:hypothetical protein
MIEKPLSVALKKEKAVVEIMKKQRADGLLISVGSILRTLITQFALQNMSVP